MAIREGAWDCPYCGQARNRGPDRFCGACGSPRGSDVKFYLPDDARVVEDEAEIERARAGPDWTCAFCGGDNPARNAFCVGCGAGRDGSPPRPVVEPTRPAEPAPAAAPKKKLGLVALFGCLGGCGAVLLLLTLLGMFLGMTRDESLTVVGMRWERTLSVERYGTVREEAWKEAVPSGARKISEKREIRSHRDVKVGSETRTRTVSKKVQTGTEKVKVGTRDMGNGYFEDVYEDRPVYETRSETERYEEPLYRKEPVYDVKVVYEVERWTPSRKATASGTDNRPSWPDPSLGSGEREGGRTESYEVSLQDGKGKIFAWTPASAADFERLSPGARVKARVDRMGNVKEVSP